MKKRIYLYESGKLQRQDNSLVYLVGKNKNYIPIIQIETIFIFGHCEMNKEVLNLLAEYKIVIIFFSFTGRYIGSFIPKQKQIGNIIIKQVLIICNYDLKWNYMKEIIIASIKNMSSILKYYNKKGHDLNEEIVMLDNIIFDINRSDINSNLMIKEANAKQIYYSSFNKLIINKDFHFTKRTTNPPRDLINAIMSYGYAILYGIIESDIYQTSLNISLPFIHGTSRQHGGLQYDIADIFKPAIIDRLIFRLINKGQIKKNHFVLNDSSVFLSKEGAKLFIEELENTLNKTVLITDKRKMTYRSIIKKEVYKIEKSITEEKIYHGYTMRW